MAKMEQASIQNYCQSKCLTEVRRALFKKRLCIVLQREASLEDATPHSPIAGENGTGKF